MAASSFRLQPESPKATTKSSELGPEYKMVAWPAIPGVVTCPALQKFDLGIVSKWNLLCCLTCPSDSRIVNYSTVGAHLKKCFKEKNMELTFSEGEVKRHCKVLNVETENLHKIPVPTTKIAPLSFMSYTKVFRCNLCLENEPNAFYISATARKNHRSKVHPEITDSDWPETEVYPELSEFTKPEEQYLEDNSIGERQRLSLDRVLAYLSEWSEPGLPNVSALDLHNINPWLDALKFAKHVNEFGPGDISRLLGLVAAPEENNQLIHLYNAAVATFIEDQKRMDTQSEVYLMNLMDDGSGEKTKTMQTLTPQTALDYGRLWGRWAVFVCRLRKLQKAQDDFYKIEFTSSQIERLDDAIDYCNPKLASKRRYSSRNILYRLGEAFWRPTASDKFRAMIKDQWSDPTIRFACLINLHPTGEFSSPRNSCHLFVRIKYFIRQTLYFWSHDYHVRNKLPLDDIVPFISDGVSRRRVTPFSKICYFTSQATFYANTSTNLPNTIWDLDSPVVNVEGRQIDFDKFRVKFAGTIRELEKLVQEDLLLGLSPESLGFKIDELTRVHDNISESKPGYSLFSDTRNDPLIKNIQHSLASKFPGQEQAQFLYEHTQDPSKPVNYNLPGCSKYIESYKRAMRMLALCMHIVGGQPGRGTEFVDLRWDNARHRARSIYMTGPGKMVYVLFYNKTTRITGLDRVVAHAIPWRLARLMLIIRSLVVPFAGKLTERLNSPQARDLQSHHPFAPAGQLMTSNDLSTELQRWFNIHLGEVVGLRVYRQFAIACQRKYMPAAFETVRRALRAVDSQGGHGDQVSEDHYAITVEEAHLLGGDTIAKYIEVSNWWWRIIFDGEEDMLTHRELGPKMAESDTFKAIQKQIEKLFNPDRIKNMLEEILKSVAQNEGVVQQFVSIVQALKLNEPPKAPVELTASQLSVFHTYRRAVAQTRRIEPEHLNLLRTYTGHRKAVWSSPEQAQALVHLIDRKSSLLIVLPTGGGKSFLFGSMQYKEQGVTVVVFPLHALLDDQVAASAVRDPARPWIRWRKELIMHDGVVAVSIETSAPNRDFMQWCAALNSKQLLSRIVLDECHLLPGHKNFRPVMSQLKPFVETKVPLVCTTATMPPDLEEELFYGIGQPTWQVIRAGTQRPNLHFRIARYADNKAAAGALVLLLEKYKPQLSKGDGILILVRYSQVAEELSRLLGFPCYYSAMSNTRKDCIAQDWISGRVPILIGTTAIGTGVHHGQCLIVIHFDIPYGLIPYAQETGRAGRGGQNALCIILHWGRLQEEDKIDFQAQRALNDMMQSNDCIRLHLSRCNDGSDRIVTCSSGAYQLCGRCIVPTRLAEAKSGFKFTPEQLKITSSDYVLQAGSLPSDLIDLDGWEPDEAVEVAELTENLRKMHSSSPIEPAESELPVMDHEPYINHEADYSDHENEAHHQPQYSEPEDGHNTPLHPSPESGNDFEAVQSDYNETLLAPAQQLLGQIMNVQPVATMSTLASTEDLSASKTGQTFKRSDAPQSPGSTGPSKRPLSPSDAPDEQPFQLVARRHQHSMSIPHSLTDAQMSSLGPSDVPNQQPFQSVVQRHQPSKSESHSSMSAPVRSMSPGPSSRHRSAGSTSAQRRPLGLRLSTTGSSAKALGKRPADPPQLQGAWKTSLNLNPNSKPQQWAKATGTKTDVLPTQAAAMDIDEVPHLETAEKQSKDQPMTSAHINHPMLVEWTDTLHHTQLVSPPQNPALATYTRHRPEPDSPERRKQPIPTTQEQRTYLHQSRQPLNVVGTQVLRDANRALQRRAEPQPQNTGSPTGFITTRNLLILKSNAAGWCYYCLTQGNIFSTHIFNQCTAIQVRRDYKLPWCIHQGRMFIDMRKWVRSTMAYTGNICSAGKNNCSVNDLIWPFCWLAYENKEIRAEMKRVIGIKEEELGTIEKYLTWLVSEYRGGRAFYRDEESVLYNCQALLMLVVIGMHCYAPPGEV
ncbi:Helicase conserved C-terminal domain [Ceratobasidium sp. AG-Ba]|nr:Helicase conserved C-terminal domain [Ceratobasidium sp. AG-Ba]